MTACNARPPEGHPLRSWGVACHLSDDHLEFSEPHSWDIDAVMARHEKLTLAFNTLRRHFPGRPIARIDAQLPRPIMVFEVDEETGERAREPYRRWGDLPAGPWVLVTYENGEEYAIWKVTGQVYKVGPDGAVEEDPLT